MKYFLLIIASIIVFSFFAFSHIQNIIQDNKINHQSLKDNSMLNAKIRHAYVAGKFYPASKDELENDIMAYLRAVDFDFSGQGKPRAIMVPHAGYVFSAPVAAYAYKSLAGQNIKRVFLLGNSHTNFFDGIAIDDNDYWETPLGKIAVDLDVASEMARLSSRIFLDKEKHKGDHILEAQIPFLQSVLGDFKIIPIVFGNKNHNDYKELARVLAQVLEDDDLLVVSSDMSHYPSYDDANKIDAETLQKIKNKDVDVLSEYVDLVLAEGIQGEETLLCGIDGVKTMMLLAKEFSWRGEVLKYANSGDSLHGDKNSVVGYGAFAFFDNKKNDKKDDNLNAEQKNILRDIAKKTIEAYVRDGVVLDFDIKDEALNKKQGAFVTLHKNGKLRGCIGRILPGNEPLWEVVRDMAIAAATEDNRFLPVGADELGDLDYEISVLSVPKKINNWQEIELGRHGVIVQKGFRSGVFLPQVAEETGWSKEEFLRHLCADKAGLNYDCYLDDDVDIKVFEAQVF